MTGFVVGAAEKRNSYPYGLQSTIWDETVKICGADQDFRRRDMFDAVAAAALRSAKLIQRATLKIYAGAPHGLADTHKKQLNADLLAFLRT